MDWPGSVWPYTNACHQLVMPAGPNRRTNAAASTAQSPAQLRNGRKRPLAASARGTRITVCGLRAVAKASATPADSGRSFVQSHHAGASGETSHATRGGWMKGSDEVM